MNEVFQNELSVIPTGVDTHDNTMMSDFAYCERKYALAQLCYLRKREIAFPLSFGALLHTGLDHYYSSLLRDGTDRNWMQAAEAAVVSMNAVDYIDPVDGHRTKGRAIDVIIDYAKKYQEDSDLYEILFTETPFDVTESDGFKWGGIMDLWARYHGKHWPIDHKSTSQFGTYFYDDFRRSPQFLGYTQAGKSLHGVQPDGVLLNVLVVRKNDQQFDRRPVTFADYMLIEAKRMQINNYRKIHQKLQDTLTQYGETVEGKRAAAFDIDIWQPNFYNCVGKYGRCPYYDLCDSRPENRARVIDYEFEEKKWDWRESRD